MARSVDYLNGAELVIFKSAHELREDDWHWFEEDIVLSLKSIAPSLEVCNKWDSNETKIILANGLVEVGLAEYNGLVSISIRPIEADYYQNVEGLGKNWIEKMRSKFEALGDLSKIGTFSNGEAMFHSKDNKTFSSKEGFCDWA